MLKRLLRFPRAARTDAKMKKDEKKRIVFRLIAVMLTTRDGILMDRGRGSLRRNCAAGGPDRQICPAPARERSISCFNDRYVGRYVKSAGCRNRISSVLSTRSRSLFKGS